MCIPLDVTVPAYNWGTILSIQCIFKIIKFRKKKKKRPFEVISMNSTLFFLSMFMGSPSKIDFFFQVWWKETLKVISKRCCTMERRENTATAWEKASGSERGKKSFQDTSPASGSGLSWVALSPQPAVQTRDTLSCRAAMSIEAVVIPLAQEWDCAYCIFSDRRAGYKILLLVMLPPHQKHGDSRRSILCSKNLMASFPGSPVV